MFTEGLKMEDGSFSLDITYSKKTLVDKGCYGSFEGESEYEQRTTTIYLGHTKSSVAPILISYRTLKKNFFSYFLFVFLYFSLLLFTKHALYFSLFAFRMFRLFKCIFSFLFYTILSLDGLLSSLSLLWSDSWTSGIFFGVWARVYIPVILDN